jgi:hypothetical protein
MLLSMYKNSFDSVPCSKALAGTTQPVPLEAYFLITAARMIRMAIISAPG